MDFRRRCTALGVVFCLFTETASSPTTYFSRTDVNCFSVTTASFSDEALASPSVFIAQLLRRISHGHPPETAGSLLQPLSSRAPVSIISRKIGTEMAAAIATFLLLSLGWAYLTGQASNPTSLQTDPHFVEHSLIPITLMSAAIAAFFEERIEAHQNHVTEYTRNRSLSLLKRTIGFIALGLVCDIPWVSFIYLGVLPHVPGIGYLPQEWASTLLDILFLAPLVIDRDIYYMGEKLLKWLSHRAAVEAVKKEFFVFYCQVLPVSFLCILAAMYARHIPLLSYIFVNAEIIWWDLMWARAMRPNPQVVRDTQLFGISKKLHHYLKPLKRFDRWSRQGDFILSTIFGLSVASTAYLLHPTGTIAFFLKLGFLGWLDIMLTLPIIRWSKQSPSAKLCHEASRELPEAA